MTILDDEGFIDFDRCEIDLSLLDNLNTILNKNLIKEKMDSELRKITIKDRVGNFSIFIFLPNHNIELECVFLIEGQNGLIRLEDIGQV